MKVTTNNGNHIDVHKFILSAWKIQGDRGAIAAAAAIGLAKEWQTILNDAIVTESRGQHGCSDTVCRICEAYHV